MEKACHVQLVMLSKSKLVLVYRPDNKIIKNNCTLPWSSLKPCSPLMAIFYFSHAFQLNSTSRTQLTITTDNVILLYIDLRLHTLIVHQLKDTSFTLNLLYIPLLWRYTFVIQILNLFQGICFLFILCLPSISYKCVLAQHTQTLRNV